VLRNLGRHFRLVLVDNRGSGQSDLPPGSFGVADMADDIVSVLDRAGIRRAHVMGVSLGGMVAQELAVDHPERIGDLILVSTTPGWPFAYPMPAASAALIARTGSLTREVAARCHTENALSARTVLERPEVADRAQLVIFSELGHLLFWEEPDRFVDAVTLFLLAERAPRKVLHSGDGKH
jgi:pimeloyl-ACP methyl ester carboxylesterase